MGTILATRSVDLVGGRTVSTPREGEACRHAGKPAAFYL